MFSIFGRNTFWRRLVLFLAAAPMTFLGASYLGTVTQSAVVASVDDLEIPLTEYQYRANAALENYRARAGVDALTPEVEQAVRNAALRELVSEYMVRAALRENNLDASGAEMARVVRDNPEFQDEDGAFSPELFRRYVGDAAGYQRRLAEALRAQPVLDVFSADIIAAPTQQRLKNFLGHRRVVRAAPLTAESLEAAGFAKVTLAPGEVEDFYDDNPEEFAVEERADFQYMIFSADVFAANMPVSESELEEEYAFYQDELTAAERRRVRHILVGGEDEAREIFAQLNSASAGVDEFAAAAREHSTDAGSAINGGDLGYMLAGDLPEALDEAVFAAAVGEATGPVESNSGWHILWVEEAVGGAAPPLAQVREQMTRRVRSRKAEEIVVDHLARLEEVAYLEVGSLEPLLLELQNIAAGESDSSGAEESGGETESTGGESESQNENESAAEKESTIESTSENDDGAPKPVLTVEVKTAEKVSRFAAENAPPFDSEVVLAEAFSERILQRGETSGALEAEDGRHIFLRAAQYVPPRQKPLSEVRDEAQARVWARKAARRLRFQLEIAQSGESLAEEAGEDAPIEINPEPLRDSFDSLAAAARFGGAVTLLFGEEPDAQGWSGEALFGIFLANLTRGFPAYAVGADGESLRLFRVDEIIPPDEDDETLQLAEEEREALRARLLQGGYLQYLGQRMQVDLNEIALRQESEGQQPQAPAQ